MNEISEIRKRLNKDIGNILSLALTSHENECQMHLKTRFPDKIIKIAHELNEFLDKTFEDLDIEKDRKSIRYFMCEMTDDEFFQFVKEAQDQEFILNVIHQE